MVINIISSIKNSKRTTNISNPLVRYSSSFFPPVVQTIAGQTLEPKPHKRAALPRNYRCTRRELLVAVALRGNYLRRNDCCWKIQTSAGPLCRG